MTRFIRLRFRRLVIVGAISAGAVALALGLTTSAANAAPTWGGPGPTPTPVYTPPTDHHHHDKTICFFSLETEHDALPPEFSQGGDQYGQPQSSPTYTDPAGQPSSAPVYGQPNDQPNVEREAVIVVQEVKVCVTEVKNHDQYGGDSWGGDHNRSDDVVTVRDVTGPFAWVVPASGIEPTPSGLPYSIAGMMARGAH